MKHFDLGTEVIIVSCLTVNKAQQLLQGLQATGNEDQQLSSVIEMCQVSFMGIDT